MLRERARAKVRVLFLVDAFGSQHLSQGVDRLAARRRASKSRGCGQLRWFTIRDATDRSHVRVVVVDGRVG